MLVCPNCQFENSDSAKFCKSCGYKLENFDVASSATSNVTPVCPNCGADLKSGAKFCSKCGIAVTASPVPAQIPEPEPKTEILLPTPEAIVQTDILMPESASAPQPAGESTLSVCPNCGALLKPNTKFCAKCGIMISSSAAKPSSSASQPVSNPAPVPQPASNPTSIKPTQKNKKLSVVAIIVLVLLILLGGGFYALSKTDLLTKLPWLSDEDSSEEDSKESGDSDKDEKAEDSQKETLPKTTEKTDGTKSTDTASDLEKELALIAKQFSAAEDKMDSEDYAGATTDLEGALNAYADLVSEYDSQDVTDTVGPLAETAFDLYTKSVLKQVEGWESQPPTAPLYQQIDLTMNASFKFADQLKESGLTVATDALETDYAEFPGRYKEKYILAFNDLVTGEQWSRTTAWMYMQDAASVGLVDKSDPDDPLTLRYAYALAWFTQKETSEGRADESLTDEDAIHSILVVAENADYNPVLMRELALCYDASGDSRRSKLIQDACIDVRNYLANNEDIYINAEDLFVPGKSSKASSTITLNDFWYFNDFGDYSPSKTNGLSPEGRAYVRDVYQQAISSL